jgi:hypothetical protein
VQKEDSKRPEVEIRHHWMLHCLCLNRRPWPKTWFCLLEKPRRLKYYSTILRAPFKIYLLWLLLLVWHNWLHLDMKKSLHLWSSFEYLRWLNTTCPFKKLGDTDLFWGVHPLKLFLWTVPTENPASLAVWSLRARSSLSQKVTFVPQMREINTSNRS